MADMQIFENPEFGKIRTIEADGDSWIVAADICDVFGVSNGRNITARLDDDEIHVYTVDTNKGRRNVTCVNEAGLYEMLMSMNPAKSKARGVSDEEIARKQEQLKKFKRWVTHDVLPSIRKNGGYIAGQEKMTDAEILANAMLVAQRTIAARDARIAALSSENTLLAEKNEELTPKGEYYDRLVENNSTMSLTDSAKALGIKPKTFINFLIADKFLYRRSKKGPLLPYEEKNHGYFEVKDRTSTKTGWAGAQTLTTVKGREKFMQMKDDGYFD